MATQRRSHMVVHWLKLVRWPNLLIAAFLQLLLRYALVEPFNFPRALSDSAFLIGVFATILLMAAGNIINDIFDQKADAINKPHRLIVGRWTSEDWAWRVYGTFTIVGVLIGFLLAVHIGKWIYASLPLITAALLYFYSTEYKTKPLIGNLIISFLGSILIITVLMYDIIPVIHAYNPEAGKAVIYIFLIYAAFSFGSTLLREWIKTLEDVEGDRKAGYETLPIRIGVRIARRLTILWAAFLLILLTAFTWVYTSNYLRVYLLLLPVLLNAYILYLLIRTENYTKAQKICKIYMLAGILSIAVFTLQVLGWKAFF